MMRGQGIDSYEFRDHEDYAKWYAVEYHELDYDTTIVKTVKHDDECWIVNVQDDFDNDVQLRVTVGEVEVYPTYNEPAYEATESLLFLSRLRAKEALLDALDEHSHDDDAETRLVDVLYVSLQVTEFIYEVQNDFSVSVIVTPETTKVVFL